MYQTDVTRPVPLDGRIDIPPQELTWDSTIRDLLTNSFNLSDNLINPDQPPRFIRVFAERWQVNYQTSGIEDESAQTVLEISVTARPVFPGVITYKVPEEQLQG